MKRTLCLMAILAAIASPAASQVPAALEVDTARNGIFEPGELVDLIPSWRNETPASLNFSGTMSNMTGPLGAVYSLDDPSGDYGTVPANSTAACSDCYIVGVTNPLNRPTLHWDAAVTETLTTSPTKTWALHIGRSFADVPLASGFYRFVETLLHKNITSGCTTTQYCPGIAATREQMAVFVLVAKEGAGYVPPACGAAPMFGDVPTSSPFCRWIEELARRAVVSGCGGGNYCPTAAVARDQMAIFVLRTLDPALTPPPCTTPMYNDVPASSPFCRWVEELTRRGAVSGCGGGNYCPIDGVTREQMSVFISVPFALALYGP